MDSKQYIENATRTESIPARLELNQFTFADLIGVMVTAGRIADQFKRQLFYGQPVDIGVFEQATYVMEARLSRMRKVADAGHDINVRMSDDMFANKPGRTGELGDMDNVNIRLFHCAIGILSEAGEMFEALEKQLVSGKLDLVNFGEEVGDVEWYQAVGFDETGVSEASCREANIAKLHKRFPEKFNNHDATNRDLSAERTELDSMVKESTSEEAAARFPNPGEVVAPRGTRAKGRSPD